MTTAMVRDALEHRAREQHERSDDRGDHDDVDQQAERLGLGAQRVQHD
jgi:hypothetical protein